MRAIPKVSGETIFGVSSAPFRPKTLKCGAKFNPVSDLRRLDAISHPEDTEQDAPLQIDSSSGPSLSKKDKVQFAAEKDNPVHV